jgi:4-hydroxybenzoate polyprenyltransferase
VDERIEIAERDWLICSLLWVAIATLALGPFGFAARVGRGLFVLMLGLHAAEALYAAIRARRRALDWRLWFLRTMVLGALGLLRLNAHIGEKQRARSAR